MADKLEMAISRYKQLLTAERDLANAENRLELAIKGLSLNEREKYAKATLEIGEQHNRRAKKSENN